MKIRPIKTEVDYKKALNEIERLMDSTPGTQRGDDLEVLGVAEVLNRRRPLSIEMIRKLHEGLGISAEILIRPYAIKKSAALEI